MSTKRVPLNPESLSISFQCLNSINSNSKCPVLTIELPIRFSDPPAAFLNSQEVEISVYRILDPEHREPFISLGRIFIASGLTPLHGLKSFNLRSPTYDSTLSGVAPFPEIWVGLGLAVEVVKELGRYEEMEGFLESAKAFSVEDKETGGLVHNWRIGTALIPREQYSLEAIISTKFPRIILLPTNKEIRTLLTSSSPVPPNKSLSSVPRTFEGLLTKLLELTLFEYESYLGFLDDSDDSDTTIISPQSSPRLGIVREELYPSNLFTIISAFLVQDGLQKDTNLVGSVYKIAADLVVERGDLKSVEGIKKSRLGLLDVLALLWMSGFMKTFQRPLEVTVEPRLKEGVREYDEVISRLAIVESTILPVSGHLNQVESKMNTLQEDLLSLRRIVDETVLQNYRFPLSSTGIQPVRIQSSIMGSYGWKDILIGGLVVIVAVQWLALSQS